MKVYYSGQYCLVYSICYTTVVALPYVLQVADRVISSMNLNAEDVFLCQGTLRPDLIESASHLVSGKADTIKTHHNDSGLVRKLRETGRVVEPLKDFHKDEVSITKLVWLYFL